MIDISHVIAPRSDQQNADDFIAGPRTIRIRDLKVLEKGQEQPLWVYFDGDENKPWKPCKGMARILVFVWGRPEQWIGRSLTLYRDPGVSFGNEAVGGIRISHMSHIDKEIAMQLTVKRGAKRRYTVKPLQSAPSTPVDVSAPEPAAGSVASAAAGLNEQIGACKTEAELKGWHDKNKSGFGMLEAETFEAVKAAYQRRKRELADDREMVA